MIIIADTHVHLYECFDTLKALRHGARNLLRLAAADEPVACVLVLAERRGQTGFARIRAGDVLLADCRVERLAEAHALRISGLATPLYLIAGRQIATAEGLELLTFAGDDSLEDRRTLDETLRGILAAGHVPVLPWSPGKWTLRRARLVYAAIVDLPVGLVLLGDSSLRPRVWPEPRLLSLARSRGLRVIAGSDPLPFAGEEEWIGSYASIAIGEFDHERPAQSLGRVLLARDTRVMTVGSRRPALSVANSVARLFLSRAMRNIRGPFRMDRRSPRR